MNEKKPNSLISLKESILCNSLGGFTLMELMMVVLLVGILAIVAIPRMPDMTGIRLQKAADTLQSDMRYVQRLAMNTQKRTRIEFSEADESYSIYIEDNYGEFDWVRVRNPLTQNVFDVQLNSEEYEDVYITRVFFNSNDWDLIFDEYGRPYAYKVQGDKIEDLNNDSLTGVRLDVDDSDDNDGLDVLVTQNTGRVNIQDAS